MWGAGEEEMSVTDEEVRCSALVHGVRSEYSTLDCR